jgi:hypothetical protein
MIYAKLYSHALVYLSHWYVSKLHLICVHVHVHVCTLMMHMYLIKIVYCMHHVATLAFPYYNFVRKTYISSSPVDCKSWNIERLAIGFNVMYMYMYM